MDTASTTKKRARSSSGEMESSTSSSEPPHKKQLPAETLGVPTNIKKSAAISPDSFRSPLRDVEPSTISIQKARDILAYAQLGDPRSFKLAVKETFSFLCMSPRNQEYIQTYLSLIYVGKTASHYFHLPLSSEQEPNAETWHFLLEQLSCQLNDLKRASEIAVLACNLLYHAFEEKREWPIEFVQAFLEDSFGKRLWVDDESARSFVCGILSVSPKDRATDLYLADDDSKTSQNASPFGPPYLTNSTSRNGYMERYSDQNVRDRVSNYVSQLIEFHLATLNSQDLLFPAQGASASDGLKSLIRTLSLLMPYAHIRPVAARYLDAWFANPQSARHAKDLFRRMSINTVDITATDVDVVRLVLRYKSVPSNQPQLFFEMLSTLASQQPIFRTKLLQDIVSDLLVQEISTQSVGAKTLGRLFESSLGSENEASLASVIHELALDAKFGPQLKVIIPILMSYYPQSQMGSSHSKNLNLTRLCNAISSPYYNLSNMLGQIESSVVVHWCQNVTDTIMSLLIYSVPKVLYEQSSAGASLVSSIVSQREEAVRSYARNSTQIQTAAVDWCHTVLPSYLASVAPHVIPTLLRRILLLDPLSSSYYLGNITLTAEQLNALAQALYSSPISENMVMSLILCGSNPAISRPEEEILEILEHILIRALRMPNGYDLLPDLTNPLFLTHLFRLSAFQPPIQQLELPTGEKIEIGESSALRWAVRQRTWKLLGLLLLCAASKPATTGALAWANVPMAKALLEIILTRSFTASSSSSTRDPRSRKLYLEHETTQARLLPHLEKIVSSSSMASSSGEIFLFDPFTTVCEPPKTFLSWIHELEVEFKLSRQMIKNRNHVDFVVSDLMKRDGLRSVLWLSPLISSDLSIISLLPPKCLIILLIASQANQPSSQIPSITPLTVTKAILKNLEAEISSSVASACTVWQFLLNFLSSESNHIRRSTHRALTMLICGLELPQSSSSPLKELLVTSSSHQFLKDGDSVLSSSPPTSSSSTSISISNQSHSSPFSWLHFVHSIPHYKTLYDIIEESLVNAVKSETDADTIDRILNFLKSSRQSSNGPPLSLDDLSFLCDIIYTLLNTSSTQQSVILGHNDLLKTIVQILISMLQTTTPPSPNPSQSVVRWHNSSETPSDINFNVIHSALTVLAKQSIFFDSQSFDKSYLASLALEFSSKTLEYPVGHAHTSLKGFLDSFDTALSSRLSGSSLASNYFKSPDKTNNKVSHPIDVAEGENGKKLSRNEILAICGYNDTEEGDEHAQSVSHMDIEREKERLAVNNLTEAALAMFLEFKENPSGALQTLQSALHACTESTSIEEISNLNQAVIYAVLQGPQDSKKKAALFQWHQLLLQMHQKTFHATCTADGLSQVEAQETRRLHSLSQEISILQPFITPTAPNSVFTIGSESVERWLLPKDLKQMASFVPSSMNVADATHACTQLITFIQQSMSEGVSGAQLQRAMTCLVQFAAICDFSPLIEFVFLRQPNSNSCSCFAFKSLLVEVIHGDGSWHAKKAVLDLILGPPDSDLVQKETGVVGSGSGSGSGSGLGLGMRMGLEKISNFEVSLALKFLTLHLESHAGKSWSDHLLSISNKVATPLKDRPASLINFSKTQMMRLVDLVMHDLTEIPMFDEKEMGSERKDPRKRVFERASLLLASCNLQDSKRDETKVLWLIEAISQTPNAHSMNIMRWMDDMTRASLAGGNSLNFRPEHLVHRFSSHNSPNNMDLDDDMNRYVANASLTYTRLKPLREDEACESILTYIYFECPWQVFSVIRHFTNRVSATNGHSKLDYTIHRLLKRLLQDGSHYSELLMLRALALSHPAFIIKFLPTMSALLNGRTQAGAEDFLQQKSDEIFSNVLALVEMLIPLIFHDKMAKTFLSDLMEEYFKLLESMCEGTMTKRSGRAISLTSQDSNQHPESKWLHNERITRLVAHFSNFLAAYCAESLVISEAVSSLQPHLELLSKVSSCLPNIESLKKVVHAVQMRTVAPEMEPIIDLPTIHSIRDLLSQYPDLNKVWISSTRENILTQIQEALHRIETTISENPTSLTLTPYYDRQKVSILNYIINYILPMAQWSTQAISKQATMILKSEKEIQSSQSLSLISPFVSHTIDLIRRSSLCITSIYLQVFPREGERVISSFLSCFRSPLPELRQDALPYAKIVCLSCVSHPQQVELMSALFAMGKIGQNPLRDIISVLSDLM